MASINSQPDHVESADIRAKFTNRSNFPTVSLSADNQLQTTPLLSSTPVTVSKALVRSYPYLLLLNKTLSVLTWTGSDQWLSVLVAVSYAILILYFETLLTYFGHVLAVGLLGLFAYISTQIEKELHQNMTLDEIVQTLTSVSVKADILASPLVALELTPYDLKRLLFTTVFLSPFYIVIGMFLVTPRTWILFSGLFWLTYHSSWSRVTRRILWKSKSVKLLCFYVTGLDLNGAHSNKNSIFKIAMNKTKKKLSTLGSGGNGSDVPIRFTYVLFENQRRWLGIGWTSNLLSYERAPWTDEFLNEAQPPESFELPEFTDKSGMVWRWVDKTWRLDLTNDGSLQLSSSKPRSTTDPKADDGFIYYDNTWKSPSTEDSFGKYTRRRRWVRTAELYSPEGYSSSVSSELNPERGPVSSSGADPVSKRSVSTSSRRKSIRFDDTPTVVESVLFGPQGVKEEAPTTSADNIKKEKVAEAKEEKEIDIEPEQEKEQVNVEETKDAIEKDKSKAKTD
ncbi:Peroxisome size and maintenance regulator [Komagataella phaffii CBS 7435]|uniref:Peroxisomal integral membrane protein, involved in negative regulation of peroxisome number n=3 Tax=Komagataella TaxID=460517 RepID=C4QYD8_KOMPG|nr:Peroxisomal integral membrane protein, involved in negative regulation of peroxisome number [Komagataella phaffii GS115]ABU54840.1 Pex30p [Komagataella pastoris]AOA61616.1 GQ67_01750T0 [Komagataella phaffii]CAH2447084.1 Peroxisome size and maintenance regulator [Komagataella phaffii CBS 7435]AOA66008.1 GQ68_01765T0 [Komagataella phaffii GS115]CAY68261.1 Peroxisomal integral membrane protein, involved in negative regulation of peroxisome number [Komagataella phaffii GS115]